MVDISHEDINDLRERMDDLESKIVELHQLLGQVLGQQMQSDVRTKFFKIFFEKE